MDSPGYRSSQPLSAEIANQLLADSAQKKLGGWQVVKANSTYIAVFSAKVNANGGEKDLAAAVISAARSADDLENALTQKDVF